MKRIKIIHRTDFRQFMMENTIIRNSLPKSAKHTFTNIHKYSQWKTMVLQNTVASSFVIACPEESHDADDLGRRMPKAKTVWYFLNFLENRTIYKWYQKATRNLPETMPCRMHPHAKICDLRSAKVLWPPEWCGQLEGRGSRSAYSAVQRLPCPRWASGVQQQNRPRRWRRKVSPVNSTTSPQTPVISRFETYDEAWWNMMKPMLKPILFHWHHVSILPIPTLVLQDSPCAAPSPSPCAHPFVLKNSKKPSASQRKDNSMLKRTVKKASHTLNGRRSELGHGKGHGKTPTQLTWPVPQQLPQSSAMHAISRHATKAVMVCKAHFVLSFSVSQFQTLGVAVSIATLLAQMLAEFRHMFLEAWSNPHQSCPLSSEKF